MYESSSGESLYSNEDRKDKDKTTIGDEAIENANKRHRDATKIIEKNKVDGKEYFTTPLVSYFGEVRNKGIAPKGTGFVHRKAGDLPHDLNMKSFYLRDDYIDSICKGL